MKLCLNLSLFEDPLDVRCSDSKSETVKRLHMDNLVHTLCEPFQPQLPLPLEAHCRPSYSEGGSLYKSSHPHNSIVIVCTWSKRRERRYV